MLWHSLSSFDDKKVSSKDTNHFTAALAEKTVGSTDDSLRFKSYDVAAIDLLGTYSFKFSLKTNTMKR